VQINPEPAIFTGMKIGFLYYKFFPIEGGAAIHGYNLAKELSLLGFELYKLNGEQDPFTIKLKNPVTGFFWMLFNCDLFYARMDYFIKIRNILTVVAILLGKRVIVELNAPSDELHLYGKEKSYIKRVDRLMARILKRADSVIVVSSPIEKYCRIQLGLEKVVVVENGANPFEISDAGVSEDIVHQLTVIKSTWQKIVVWSGSINKMQNLEDLFILAEKAKKKAAFLIIAKEEQGENLKDVNLPNIFILRGLNRPDVEYLIKKAHVGIALYEDYHWSRWGFYNSSLKMFEYLNNGLLTISNKKGTEIQRSNPNFRYARNLDEMLTFIDEKTPETGSPSQYRTWKHVAAEISNLIHRPDPA
jgi:glycosyltransferase involved in cell wall biosynthesis